MRAFYSVALILTVLAFFTSFSSPSQANNDDDYIKFTREYSVEESYAFFDLQRTPFKKDISKLSEKDKRYLDHLFFVTDMTLKARVNMMQYYFAGTHKKHIGTYNKKINELLGSFSMIEAPSHDMKMVEKQLIESITVQQEFMNEWAQARGPAFQRLKHDYASHFLVQASHLKIQRAYTNLRLIYPDEDEYNLQAFKDHLSALDMIN